MLACLAGVSASPCLAGSPLYNFVKANTSEEQFRHDRADCIAKATTVYRAACSTHMGFAADGPSGALQARSETTCPSQGTPSSSTNTPRFVRCMMTKGYQQGAPSMASRAGLYELRQFSNRAILNRRDLAGTQPFVQIRASTDALAQPGLVFRSCVAPDGALPFGAVAELSSSCAYSNVVATPRGFAADARCQDRFIHLMFDAAAPDRSEFTVIGERKPGAAVPHIEKYQIVWIAPDCGDLPPRAVRLPDGRVMPAASPAPAVRSFETRLP
jgi:hypothetical protein